MFRGEHINTTEDRAVLHVALRDPRDQRPGRRRAGRRRDVHEVLDRMARASPTGSAAATWTGHTGERIRAVVNIGIGGSDLGPAMAYQALRDYSDRVADLPVRLQHRPDRPGRGDPRPRPGDHAVHRRVEDVHHAGDADQRHARRGAGCSTGSAGTSSAVAKHFVAVSTNAEKVAAFGIDTDNMFGFWDWVGGRYSFDVGDRAVADGGDRAGAVPGDARRLPHHRRALPHRAATRRTCRRCSGLISRLVHRLLRRPDPGGAALLAVPGPLPGLPAAAVHGEQRQVGDAATARRSTCDTGEVVWGEPGTNGQHAFYQLLHQGTRLVPADFIGFAAAQPRPRRGMHDLFMANFLAQPRALAFGRPPRRSPPRARAADVVPHKVMPGNHPSQRDRRAEADPVDARPAGRRLRAPGLHPGRRSGASTRFDQWGVELGQG